MEQQDDRFACIGKDPRFRQMKRKDRKFKVDKRFHGMFKDKKFKLKYTVDKRGRPVNTSSDDHLRRYYDLSESEDEVDKVSMKKKKGNSKTLKPKKEKKKVAKTVKSEKERQMMADSDKFKSAKKQLKKNSNKLQHQSLEESDSTSGFGEERNSEEDVDEEVLQQNGDSEQEDSSKDAKNEDYEEDSEEESEDSESDIDVADPARGIGVLESSSEDEDQDEGDDGDDDEKGKDEFDHQWGELHQEATEVSEATHRLAVCNMDWDRIKAQDLLVLLNSFKSTGGVIHSVKIYPSEFGLKRMKEEDLKGPQELTEKPKNSTAGNDGYHMERLRQYQLNRLRYYYAVVECDSAETADHIYKECDGLEYESSATKIDLRFIPDDMTFEQEPTSVSNELPNLAAYKPSQFSNTALNQTKVDLTWDETDQERIALTTRKFTKEDIESMDVQAYLASSSDENDDPYAGIEEPDFGRPANEDNLVAQQRQADSGSDEEEEARLSAYKEMISAAREEQKQKEENDMEMEITWEPGLKSETEKLVKAASRTTDLTPWESYLQKRKAKQRMKRSEKRKANKGSGDEADEDKFSDDDLPSDVDLSDPYFREELDKLNQGETKSGKKKKKKAKTSELTPEEEKAKSIEKESLKLLMMDEDDNREHFSLEAIMAQEKREKKRRKKKRKIDDTEQTQDNFKLDVSDPRFKDLYRNPHFNLDPTAPEFKKTKGSQALIDEKFRQKQKNSRQNDTTETHFQTLSKANTGLESLVKSVKTKTKLHQNTKKKAK